MSTILAFRKTRAGFEQGKNLTQHAACTLNNWEVEEMVEVMMKGYHHLEVDAPFCSDLRTSSVMAPRKLVEVEQSNMGRPLTPSSLAHHCTVSGWNWAW